MRTVLTILVAALVACAFVPANAQDGVKFGMGVELTNSPTFISVTDDAIGLDSGGSMLTPAILFTIQMSPALFLEPYVGYHRESFTADAGVLGKIEDTGDDLVLGLGLLYLLNPDATVSPMLHPLVQYDMLGFTEDDGTGEAEVSMSAFSFGLGIGGMVTLKEGFFFTAEARLLYSLLGDTEITVPGFTDDIDTDGDLFNTDMAVGVRFVF